MRRVCFTIVALVSACGGSVGRPSESTRAASEPAVIDDGPSAESTAEPESIAPSAARPVERARVERGHTVAIAGVAHTFSEFSADGAVDAVGFVELTDESGETLRVPTHGCLRTRMAAVRVESVTPGPPTTAELAVAPGMGSEHAVQWMETVDLAISDRLRSPDGFVIGVRAIRERLGAIVWDLESRTGDEPFEAIAASQGGSAFGGDRLVSVESSGRRDAFGCPIARVTLERPSLVLAAVDGAEVRIRRGSRVRLGDLTVEYIGSGERRTTRGDVALVTFAITIRGRTEERVAHFDETIELAGYAIDVIDAGPYARVRLRTRP